MTLKNLTLLIVILMVGLCDKSMISGHLYVYKTKNDYTNNVSVQLSLDKESVNGYPGPGDLEYLWPAKLVNGYYLNGIFGGARTGYVSLTKTEYAKYKYAIGADSMYQLLIDKDPFTELYLLIDEDKIFDNDNGIDTIKLNNVIKEGRLEKYFEKLK